MNNIELDFNLTEETFSFGYGNRLNTKNLELLNKIYLTKLQSFEITCFDIELVFKIKQIDLTGSSNGYNLFHWVNVLSFILNEFKLGDSIRTINENGDIDFEFKDDGIHIKNYDGIFAVATLEDLQRVARVFLKKAKQVAVDNIPNIEKHEDWSRWFAELN